MNLKNKSYYEDRKKIYCINNNNNYSKLADPYTEEEILNFENENDLKIPNELRTYLINISRESIALYPYIIKLDVFDVFLEKNGYEPNYQDLDELNIIDHDKIMIERGCTKNYFMTINYSGCDYSEFLCVKGPHYNYVFNYDLELLEPLTIEHFK